MRTKNIHSVFNVRVGTDILMLNVHESDGILSKWLFAVQSTSVVPEIPREHTAGQQGVACNAG